MKFIFTVLLIGLTFFGLAQAPFLINYQGIARDASGNPISGQMISLKFEILQGSVTGPVIYTDNQTGISTGTLGVFSTQIGKNGTLGQVNWQGSGSYFLQVSMDPAGGTNLTVLGTQQIVSVPFAMHAGNVPSTYTNNVLTIGSQTHAISSGTAVTVSQGTGTNITVSAGPDYTISYAPPLLALSSNNASLSILGSNTIALPAFATPTLVPSGIATVTNGVSTYTVGVPAPGYNPVTGVLSFGSNNTVVTPTLQLSGGVLYSGPFSNSVTIPAGVTVSGTGLASVTGGPNYLINVSPPTLALSSNNLSLSIVGSNSVAFPAGVTVAAPASNMVNVTGGPTNYTVAVPAPVWTGTALIIGATTTTIAPTLAFNNGTLTVGPNTVSLAGFGPFTQAGTSVTLTTPGNNLAIGTNSATAKLDIFSNITGTTALKVNDASVANTVPAAIISSNGVKSLDVNNNSTTGVAGNFVSSGGSALTAQNNSNAFATFQAQNTSAATGAYAGNFIGGITTTGNGSTNSDFALKVNNSSSASLFNVRNDGYIGIGTTGPLSLLHIDAQLQNSPGFLIKNSRDVIGGALPMVIEASTASQTYGSTTYGRLMRLTNTTNSAFSYDFGIDGAGSFFMTNINSYTNPNLSMSLSGNVGIGTPSTGTVAKLDVNGNIRVGNSSGQIYLGSVGGINSGYTGLYSNGSGDLTFAVFKSGGTATSFGSSNSLDAVVVQNQSGNVGIGVPNPLQKLDIAGSIKMADGNQALGNVLTSDASGVASWQPLTITTTSTFAQEFLASVGSTAGTFSSSLGSFSKVNADTKIQVIIQTHLYVEDLVGNFGVVFEAKLNNSISATNSGKVAYFFDNNNTFTISNFKSVTIVAEFIPGSLPAGPYSVTMSASTTGGSATGLWIDNGNWGTNSIIIKEYR